ncbi:phospholipase D family protein [Lutimaribacter marinistellae]|uniref:Phospholipase D n=1 Tax=Lutimaribacter marinistellae TaxID=1820329 RepID=A0ABV7TQ36_9RHOB
MLGVLRTIIYVVVLFLLGGLAFRALYPVPTDTSREVSRAIPPSADTTLGAAVLPQVAAHPGLSGVSRLQDGHVSYAARIQLADMAEQSIDARYYIWQRDISGLLLLDAMKRAADRGVRVRLLLDDNGIPDLDAELAEMDAHENIEVRIFNPFVLRSPRMLSYLFDFSRLNRRMHNKSMTVDGVATIVGGRNVGDIYFSTNTEVNYFDLDVVALGDAAQDVADDFDLYWASDSAVPADLILPARPADGGLLDAAVQEVRARPGAEAYAEDVRSLPLRDEILDDTRAFEWVPMQMVSDDPAKGLGQAGEEDLMITRLLKLVERPTREAVLISAYFVPGDRLTDILVDWARSGVEVMTLTNAQEATDVLPVHSGYRKYRDRLVDAGVDVRELRSDLQKRELWEQFGLTGSTNTSLHAKTFVLDDDEIFVGSFNFDPRSARLNTEMGFLIESPTIAQAFTNQITANLDRWTYSVSRGADGELDWRRSAEGETTLYETEPKTTALSRWLVRFMGVLPIEWML